MMLKVLKLTKGDVLSFLLDTKGDVNYILIGDVGQTKEQNFYRWGKHFQLGFIKCSDLLFFFCITFSCLVD